MKLFLDANVLFSAANEASQLNRLIDVLKESHTLLTSDYAEIEAGRNLRAKRPGWEAGYKRLMRSVTVVRSVDRAVETGLAAKDRPILATAIAHRCDCLVTGDKRHFSHLFGTVVEGVKVVTPLMIAQSL
jgi:predicted nucleic acid-binding protein